jgi:hypothetical protein
VKFLLAVKLYPLREPFSTIILTLKSDPQLPSGDLRWPSEVQNPKNFPLHFFFFARTTFFIPPQAENPIGRENFMGFVGVAHAAPPSFPRSIERGEGGRTAACRLAARPTAMTW